MIPGSLGRGDDTHVIQRWYVRTESAMGMDRCTATLALGNRIEWQLPVSDLVRRRPREDHHVEGGMWLVRDPWPLVVEPRQNVMVSLDLFGPVAEEAARNGDQRLWVHFEGISVEHPHEVAQVTNALMRRWGEVKSTEDMIVDWLTREGAKGDKETQAALDVIKDGILEHRHRGGPQGAT